MCQLSKLVYYLILDQISFLPPPSLSLPSCFSAADVKELEKAIVNMVRAENSDIKQKQDQARLHIHHCQLVLVNTHSPSINTTDVKDSPLTQVSRLSSGWLALFTDSSQFIYFSLN